ncbi:hypothetical protein V6N13_144735 [Hibiscus sabdariffa]|uniref:Uncharacterized protein n=1 Tax=Hibiscus sabdariffa TaxID=183260 RepID=A0ABR2FL99_9ROSI
MANVSQGNGWLPLVQASGYYHAWAELGPKTWIVALFKLSPNLAGGRGCEGVAMMMPPPFGFSLVPAKSAR